MQIIIIGVRPLELDEIESERDESHIRRKGWKEAELYSNDFTRLRYGITFSIQPRLLLGVGGLKGVHLSVWLLVRMVGERSQILNRPNNK